MQKKNYEKNENKNVQKQNKKLQKERKKRFENNNSAWHQRATVLVCNQHIVA